MILLACRHDVSVFEFSTGLNSYKFYTKSAYSHINGTKYEFYRKNLIITFLNS